MNGGPYLVGLDAGHTVTKAAVVDRTGHLVGLAVEPTPARTAPPRWCERDMDVVAESGIGAIARAVRAAGIDPRAVAGIGIAGHGDGLYLIDAAHRPVRPAILATDTRAYRYAAQAPHQDTLLALTGQPSVPYGAPALLNWLRDNEPDAFARTAILLNCKDWLRLTLTGAVATDPTDAGAAFTDLATGEWSALALELAGVPEYQDRLPPIVASATVAAGLTAEVAAATGLRPSTPVVAGAHDVHAAALGIGAMSADGVSAILGTFNINQVVRTTPVIDRGWQVRRSLTPGTFLLMSTSPAGATAVDWVHSVQHGADFQAAVAAALQRSPLPDDPLFLPFVHGSSLVPDPGGALTGLRSWHGPVDLLRAALEGVVFNHRRHLELLAGSGPLTVAPVRVAGGGARSVAWTQLLADTTGLSIEVADAPEAGAQGAAMLAGVGSGVFGDLGDAVDACVRVDRRQDPRDDVTDTQELRYRRWLDVVMALQETAGDRDSDLALGSLP